jgi:hypothetical protein
MPPRVVAVALAAGVLAAAAVYELVLALGAGSVGPEPGDDVAGAGAVFLAALLAMVAGAVAATACVARASRLVGLLPPAAAAFLVSFVFTYDPYYAPALRRYGDGGAAGTAWILALATLAAAAAALAWFSPRIGAAVSAVALVLLLLTTMLAADGH